MALNIIIISLLYTETYPQVKTLLYCKIRNYLMSVSLQISRYLILIACFDRYALCSTNAYLRKFSHIHIARRYVIPAIILIWLIVPLHVPIFESIEGNTCVLIGIAGVYNSIYGIIFIGVIPPVLMLIFSLLIFRNLKLRQRRRQIVPTVNVNRQMQAKDQQVLAMLLVQVFAYVISTTPYTIISFYLVLKKESDMIESMNVKSTTTFILFITDMLRSVCPFTSFYLFILVSRLYRKEMKSVIYYIYQKYNLLWGRNTERQNNTTTIWNTQSIRQTTLQQQQKPTNIEPTVVRNEICTQNI